MRSGRRTRQRIVRVYRAEDGEFRIVLAGPSGEHAYRYSPDLSGDPAKAVQAICLSAMEYAWPVDVAFELQQGALPLLTDLTLSAPVQSDANRSFKPASCAS